MQLVEVGLPHAEAVHAAVAEPVSGAIESVAVREDPVGTLAKLALHALPPTVQPIVWVVQGI